LQNESSLKKMEKFPDRSEFNALGEVDTLRFELHGIDFEDNWIRELICFTPYRFARLERYKFIAVSDLRRFKRMFDDVSTLQNCLSTRYKTARQSKARQSKASANVMLSMFNQSLG